MYTRPQCRGDKLETNFITEMRYNAKVKKIYNSTKFLPHMSLAGSSIDFTGRYIVAAFSVKATFRLVYSNYIE